MVNSNSLWQHNISDDSFSGDVQIEHCWLTLRFPYRCICNDVLYSTTRCKFVNKYYLPQVKKIETCITALNKTVWFTIMLFTLLLFYIDVN